MSNPFRSLWYFHRGHQFPRSTQSSPSVSNGEGYVRAAAAQPGHTPRWVEPLAAGTLWIYLCVLITGLAASRSASTAMFLGAHHAADLGALYIVVALAVTATLYLLSEMDRRVSQDRLAMTTSLVVALGAAFFILGKPALAGGTKQWLLYGTLYVFVETCAVVTTLQFWTLSNTLFNWPQAHRWYPFVASGGIAGSMLGGWIARNAEPQAPIRLLWVLVLSGPVVAIAIVLLSRWRKRLGVAPLKPRTSRSADTSAEPLSAPSADARRSPRWYALSTTLSRVVFWTVFTTTLTDFYFKFFADQHFGGNPAGLTRFFGNYYMAVAITTLLLQIVMTPVLLHRGGAFAGLSLMPAALLLAAAANLASPTLLLALVLKLIDSGFSHSVYRSCRELLFTPLPIELVGSFKTLSEGVAGRLGLLACGAVLLLMAPLLQGWFVLCAVAVSAVAWLVAVRRLWLAYRHELPEIWEPRQRAPRTPAAQLDRAAVGR